MGPWEIYTIFQILSHAHQERIGMPLLTLSLFSVNHIDGESKPQKPHQSEFSVGNFDARPPIKRGQIHQIDLVFLHGVHDGLEKGRIYG